MKMQSNTIFITGGTSGIGKGLAEAFHRLGNQVIISGRREDRLRSICAANPGMRHFVLDVTDPASVRNIARKVIEEFPALNCVFNNSGVQRRHNFAAGKPIDDRGHARGNSDQSAWLDPRVRGIPAALEKSAKRNPAERFLGTRVCPSSRFSRCTAPRRPRSIRSRFHCGSS